MAGELSEMTGAPEADFTIELVSTQAFAKGAKVEGEPLCEVLWFERPPEMCQKVAELITRKLKALRPESDIVVSFQVLPRAGYFENGRHF